jgi:ElaB/YqjD/DUF883 family membrane-anchored ribosome-binding protein
MTNVAKPQAKAKKLANQEDEADLTSEVEEVKEDIKNLGTTLGNVASRQYERAQDMATDAVHETGETIRRNPITAVATALGLGFLLGLFKRRG